MNWTTVTIKLDDNQTQIKDVNVNELVIREGHFNIKLSQLGTSIIYIATMLFLYFSDSLLMEGLFHYITPLGPSWPYTCWSFKPYLSTCPIRHPLWFSMSCGRAKAVLFRGLLHINAVRRVTVIHSMRW